MRLQYPESIRVIRVPCTGKVDLIHILRAFERGADGVCVLGCMEGECRYESGNLRARKRVDQAKKILEAVGIGGQRVEMYNLSSSEGARFAQIARDMTASVASLGPNPVNRIGRERAA